MTEMLRNDDSATNQWGRSEFTTGGKKSAKRRVDAYELARVLDCSSQGLPYQQVLKNITL